jgi:cytochrome P450
MREREHVPLSDQESSCIRASFFGAGSDTTASILGIAFMALITHPDTLRAAHQEHDAVVGNDRTPTFDDESSLPYLRTLVKEVLHWHPVAVLGGMPHPRKTTDTKATYPRWYNDTRQLIGNSTKSSIRTHTASISTLPGRRTHRSI